MSMSMSMSMSYPYGYDGHDDTNPDDGNSPVDVDDSSTDNSNDSTGTGDSSPSDFDSTDSSLTSCSGFPLQAERSETFTVDTVRDSLPVTSIENILKTRLRDSFFFCEDLDQRRLQNTSSIDDADSAFYIGDVEAEQLDDGKLFVMFLFCCVQVAEWCLSN